VSHALTSRQRHVNAAQAVDLGVLYTAISAGMLLARRYLTGRGIDQDFADRYGSAFGRTAAKIYRTANGTEPRKAWSNVSGKWRRVNGYLPTEADVLDEAYTAYPRTADYVVEPEQAPVAAEQVCGNQWKYGKDTCAREASHIGPHRNTEALEAWSFHWFDSEGTPPEQSNACLLPDCSGEWHQDGTCTVRLPEVEFEGVDVVLSTELVAENQALEIVAFAFNMTSFETRRAMRDRASASEFTAQLRRLADAIDGAAVFLPA
jgi:hypothetical protein